jgi:adenylate kinase
MYLIFIGIQGSGKWTQARILKEKYWFEIFETGQALREITKKETELWKLVKQTIQAGKQVSPEIIENILLDFIKNSKWENIIFDWLVRNKWNKQTADKILKDYKVIYFDLDEQEAINRLLGRMYNPKTWETFPAGTEIDPKTWDKLIKRSDDEENAIKQRIKEFYEKTLPVVEEYEKEWKLIKINAKQDINKVTEEIISKLGL